jgi:hypothetical protein
MLRSYDPLTYEDGYHGLLDHIDEMLDKLIELEQKETDIKMRAKFLELIGHSTNPKAINLLKQELGSDHYEIRMWAYNALLYSDLVEGQEISKEFKENNPDEELL